LRNKKMKNLLMSKLKKSHLLKKMLKPVSHRTMRSKMSRNRPRMLLMRRNLRELTRMFITSLLR